MRPSTVHNDAVYHGGIKGCMMCLEMKAGGALHLECSCHARENMTHHLHHCHYNCVTFTFPILGEAGPLVLCPPPLPTAIQCLFLAFQGVITEPETRTTCTRLGLGLSSHSECVVRLQRFKTSVYFFGVVVFFHLFIYLQN